MAQNHFESVSVKLANMDKQTPALIQPPLKDGADARPEPGEPAPEVTASTSEPASSEARESSSRTPPPPPPPVSYTGKTDQPPPRGPASTSGKLALAVSVLALIGVGVIGWQVHELRSSSGDLRGEVAERLAAADSQATELRALSRQAQEAIGTLQGRFGAMESKVAAAEGQAAALESLYQEFSRSRSDRVLAEVTQAVTIASQQLRLAGNYEAALIALQSAEARISSPEMGHLHDLRRALMKDIDAVKSHPQIDVAGVALRLELLFGHIDRLALAYAVEPVGAAPAMDSFEAVPPGSVEGPWWRKALGFGQQLTADAWNEVRTMIRLERMDSADSVLLAPSQGVFLRENVKLRLLTARLALLANDARTYTSDLANARDWLERFFDTRDTQVQRAIEELKALEAIDMRAEAPTLTDTFAALGMVRGRSAGSESPPAEAGGSR